MERQKIQEQLEWLKTEPASSSKAFTFVGVAFLVLAALCVAAVYMGHFDSTVGLGGAAACVVIAVISLVRQSTGADRIPRKIAEIEGRLASVNGKIGDLAKEAEITLSTDESNERWLQELDAVRKQYLDWQTRETKNAWQKEQKVMYDAIYENGRPMAIPARNSSWPVKVPGTAGAKIQFQQARYDGCGQGERSLGYVA